MTAKIKYRDGYKYQLVDDYRGQLRFVRPPQPIITHFFEIDCDGLIWARRGYAWDGPSGPTFDTKDFMRGSLIHDVLYQAMRERFLNRSWREAADRELVTACLEDGMLTIRARYVYCAVRFCAAPFADPQNDKPIIEAP